jgi:hypothetical protein
MKLKAILFGTFIAVAAIYANAQNESPQELECKRMRLFAGEELKIKNFAGATSFYIKAEKICGGFDKANYDRMIQTIRNTISTETDKSRKAAYIDTLVDGYDRMEKAGHFDKANSAVRATFILQSSTLNRKKADELYIQSTQSGTSLNEAQVSMYYYNIYTMYTDAKTTVEEKAVLKKRLISEYFTLSKLITDAKMSVKSQENLTTYFNTVVRTCDDILPDLAGFMSALPQEVEAKKKAVNNFMTLLKDKGCTGSKEYEMLVDTIIKIDNSIDAVLAKAQLQNVKKQYTSSITTLNQAKGMSTDAGQKEDIEFMILEIQYHELNSYNTAYRTAMGITGSNKNKALLIAANCVAKTANSCGASTFDRKCNYLYAAELAQRGGDGGAAARFRSNGPSESDKFENNNPSSVSLSCWGVSVSLK